MEIYGNKYTRKIESVRVWVDLEFIFRRYMGPNGGIMKDVSYQDKECEWVKLLSHVWLCNLMDCSCQAPLSMGFSSKYTGVVFHFLL